MADVGGDVRVGRMFNRWLRKALLIYLQHVLTGETS